VRNSHVLFVDSMGRVYVSRSRQPAELPSMAVRRRCLTYWTARPVPQVSRRIPRTLMTLLISPSTNVISPGRDTAHRPAAAERRSVAANLGRRTCMCDVPPWGRQPWADHQRSAAKCCMGRIGQPTADGRSRVRIGERRICAAIGAAESVKDLWVALDLASRGRHLFGNVERCIRARHPPV